MTDTPIPDFARHAVNLASAGLGAAAIAVSDDFFAEAGRMLADAAPVFFPDRYDDHGKWMDGWESQRRRGPGHDWAVVRLAVPGRIMGFDVDTSHFTGNYPPAGMIEACKVEGEPGPGTGWTPITATFPLGSDAHHYLPSTSESVWSHVRLNIYPDGGVARLRVFGEPWIDHARVGAGALDLASGLVGGRVIAYSDAHYGAFHRLLAPGRGLDMGDGWETRRRRTPGNDWIIVALGARGTVRAVEVDTAHYKGNYPDACALKAADLTGYAASMADAVVTSSMFWPELVPAQKLGPDAIHRFEAGEVADLGPVTHVRLDIFPDGGVSRLRLLGTLAD